MLACDVNLWRYVCRINIAFLWTEATRCHHIDTASIGTMSASQDWGTFGKQSWLDPSTGHLIQAKLEQSKVPYAVWIGSMGLMRVKWNWKKRAVIKLHGMGFGVVNSLAYGLKAEWDGSIDAV